MSNESLGKPVNIEDFDIFGHLVADLADRTGSICMATRSEFSDMSPFAQEQIIDDWIGLLHDMKEWVHAKKRGSIQ